MIALHHFRADPDARLSLADAAAAAAMRYRVGGPLIDGLMAELGMNRTSLNGMLSGSAAPSVPDVKAPALNGSDSGEAVAS